MTNTRSKDDKYILHKRFGYAVEDKEYDSKMLKVYPQDILPFANAGFDNTQTRQITIMDMITEVEIVEDVEESNVIIAEHIDFFSNRSGSPDVRKAEQVILYQLGDTDRYFWESAGRDDNLRRCERLRFSVSDDTRLQKELTDDNTWFMEFDTLHGKKFVISTSSSDGEEYRYLFMFDAISNQIILNDNSGNEFVLNSNTPEWKIRNRDGSSASLRKEDIFLNCKGDITLNADRQILLNSNAITIKSNSTTQMDAANITQNSTCHAINAAGINLNGSMNFNGSILAGPITAAGYSTGGPGGGDSGGTISLEDGGTTESDGSMDTPDMPPMRTSVAYPDYFAAMTIINNCLQDLYDNVGAPDLVLWDDHFIKEIVPGAEMEKNKGE